MSASTVPFLTPGFVSVGKQCRKGNPSTRELTVDELSSYFHLPINEVAKKLGLCVTVLKARCRERGITRWPYRKVRKLDNIIHALERNQKCFLRDDVKKQLAILKETRDVLLSNPNSTAHLKLGKLRTAKKFLASVGPGDVERTNEGSPSRPSAARPLPGKAVLGADLGKPLVLGTGSESATGRISIDGKDGIVNGNHSAFRKIPVVLVQQRSTSSDDTTEPRRGGTLALQRQESWGSGASPHEAEDFNNFFTPSVMKQEGQDTAAASLGPSTLSSIVPNWNSLMGASMPPVPHAPWFLANIPFLPPPGFPPSALPLHGDPQQLQAFRAAYEAAFQQLMKQHVSGNQTKQNVAASH